MRRLRYRDFVLSAFSGASSGLFGFVARSVFGPGSGASLGLFGFVARFEFGPESGIVRSGLFGCAGGRAGRAPHG